MKQPTLTEMSDSLIDELSDLLDKVTKFRKKLYDLTVDVDDLARKISQLEDTDERN